MNYLMREAVLSVDPFAKQEDILEVRQLNEWDVLIEFKDGRKFVYDGFTKYHQAVYYDNINNITEEQEKRAFAHRLRVLMGRNRVSQEELAKEIGTSQTMISHYMNGKNLPTVITVRKIAKILNCSMDDFFPKDY